MTLCKILQNIMMPTGDLGGTTSTVQYMQNSCWKLYNYEINFKSLTSIDINISAVMSFIKCRPVLVALCALPLLFRLEAWWLVISYSRTLIYISEINLLRRVEGYGECLELDDSDYVSVLIGLLPEVWGLCWLTYPGSLITSQSPCFPSLSTALCHLFISLKEPKKFEG